MFHCEIWGTKPNLHIDEMVFHVASSLEAAEHFVKSGGEILPIAWWKIAEFTLNNPDWDQDANWSQCYGAKGTKLKNVDSRIRSAVKAFNKENPKGYKE